MEKPTRSRFCKLSDKFKDEPIDLNAFRIAQRVFWAKAIANEDELLDAIYERVLAVIKAVTPPLKIKGERS